MLVDRVVRARQHHIVLVVHVLQSRRSRHRDIAPAVQPQDGMVGRALEAAKGLFDVFGEFCELLLMEGVSPPVQWLIAKLHWLQEAAGRAEARAPPLVPRGQKFELERRVSAIFCTRAGSVGGLDVDRG